jgi:hypothetical protein
VALDEHRILVCGGWDVSSDVETMFSDAYVLDTKDFFWTKVDPRGDFPGYRASQSVVSIRDQVKLYFGGRARDAGTFTDDTILYKVAMTR